MQGFLLGIASGTLCLGYCAPILVPYLLGDGGNVKGNISRLGRFLAGRLVGYFCFASLAWMTSWLILQNELYRSRILALTYITLAVLLLIYTFLTPGELCLMKVSVPYLANMGRRWPVLIPIGLGIATGLNVCPPFLLIFTEAASAASFVKSLWFFFTFFLGTSLYFIPLPFLGVLSRFPQFQTVGKIATAIIALYYLSLGAIIAGGF